MSSVECADMMAVLAMALMGVEGGVALVVYTEQPLRRSASIASELSTCLWTSHRRIRGDHPFYTLWSYNAARRGIVCGALIVYTGARCLHIVPQWRLHKMNSSQKEGWACVSSMRSEA